jgi:hypothetical protein
MSVGRYHDKTTRSPPSLPIIEAWGNGNRGGFVMGICRRFGLSGAALAAAMLLAPILASAQTPEPAAGNPAINTTPKPDSVPTPGMASPSNAANIPKGSNPNSGNGNLGPGSGATPSSSASDNSIPSQTGANAQSGINDSRPSQTATNPDATAKGGASGSGGADSMSQGQYASPPTDKR